jgi:DNA-binding XRE family transcriptional regulator
MDAKKIGQKLADLRKARGLTKRQVAKDLDCSYQAICAWEYGARTPGDEWKQRLANYYDASVEEIFFALE